jgi:hypothetical protein
MPIIRRLNRNRAAHGNVVEISLNEALAHFELDIDLRSRFLRSQQNIRCVRHLERSVLQVAALQLEDRLIILFGLSLRLLRFGILHVFVFGHFEVSFLKVAAPGRHYVSSERSKIQYQ